MQNFQQKPKVMIVTFKGTGWIIYSIFFPGLMHQSHKSVCEITSGFESTEVIPI